MTREELLAEAARRSGPELAHEAWYVTHYDRRGHCDALTCWVQYATPGPTSGQDPSYAPVRAGTSRPYERLPF